MMDLGGAPAGGLPLNARWALSMIKQGENLAFWETYKAQVVSACTVLRIINSPGNFLELRLGATGLFFSGW